MKRALLFLVFGVLFYSAVQGQIKIGDNPQNIDASSVLELESNSRVLVVTRISTAEMNAITPQPGAIVYNTDLECIHYYNGVDWINVCEEVGGIPNLTTDPFINLNSTLVISTNGENNHIEVAPNSIRSEQIVDGGINGDDIQDNSIGQSKLGNDAVGRNEIRENAVGLEALDNGEVTLGTLTNTPGFITGADIVSSAAGNVLTDNGGAFYDNTAVLDAIGVNTAAIAADGDTDDQNELTDLSFNPGTNVLSLTRSDTGVTVDLSGLNNSGSDSQNLNTDNTPGNIGIDNGNTITLNVNDGDFDPNNEFQTITLSGNNLILSDGGGSIPLPSGADGVISNIGTAGNNLTVTGTGGAFNGNVDLEPLVDNAVSNNGFLITEVDGSITNEIITASTLVGNTLTITEGGNDFDIDLTGLGGGGADGVVTNIGISGNNLAVTGVSGGFNGNVDLEPLVDNAVSNNGFLTTEVDGSITNEAISNAELNGNTLEITEGGNLITADLSSLASGGTSTAADVTFVPTGNTVSGDVQAAIEELQTEIDGISTGGTANPNDELITSFTLNGTGLDIAEGANILPTVDLNLVFATDLELAAINVDDADANPTNEIQAITSTDNSVTITPSGNDFDLSVAAGTDDQNMGAATLTGTDLTINIEGGNPTTADLGALATDIELAALSVDDADADPNNEIQTISSPDASVTVTPVGNNYELTVVGGSTDDQNMGAATLTGTDLTINIEGGNPTTADLGALATDIELAALSVDDADADPNNEIQTISSPDASVTVTPVGNNYELTVVGGSTDDQNMGAATLTGTDLTINIEGGNPTTADLGALATDIELAALSVDDADADPNNEIQTISSPDASVTVTPVGNNYELTVVGGSTDDQNMGAATLTGTDLTINIEGGNPTTADLGALATDLELAAAITASESLDNDTDSGNEIQTISSPDASVTVTPVGNNYELTVVGGSTDDQNMGAATLTGTDLTINIEGGNPTTADLGALATDIELAALSVDDADADPNNEIQTISSPDASVTVTPVGNNYELTVVGGSTDDQNMGAATLTGTDLTINIEGGNPTTADLGALATDIELAALSVDDADADPNNEIQTISSPDASVTVTPVGNNYELTVVGGSTDDQNMGAATLTGTDLTINIEGGNPTTADLGALATDIELAALSVDDADADPNNEIQNLSILGDQLTISGVGGNTVTLPAAGAADWSTLTNIPAGFADDVDDTLDETAVDAFVANNGFLTAEVDGDATNEIQTLTSPDNSLDITPIGNNYTIEINSVQGSLGGPSVIVPNSIGQGDIGINAVGNGEIRLNAVGQSEIQTGGVATGEIENLTIINEDISATAAIDGSKINPIFTADISTTGNLQVDGNVNVTGTHSPVPDYVFQKYFTDYSSIDPSYIFNDLSTVESFIRTNYHLPGVKSAEEIKEQGFWNLSEASKINLEKIEELFLHTIAQEKKIKALKSENDVLSKELERLRKDVADIKTALKKQ